MAYLVRTPYMFTMDSDAYPTSAEWLEYHVSKINDKVKCSGNVFTPHRNHVHVSALMLETNVFRMLNMSFVAKGDDLDYGKPERTAYDVGEKISWDLRDNGFEVCADNSFGNYVHHDWLGTRKSAPIELQKFA
jgi:hypothetical protein